MILNPVVATVLDKAAENVSETAVMPTKLKSFGRERGDNGFDALTAVAYAMVDCDVTDTVEMESGNPHLSEIMQAVADFGGVPEADRETQDMRFEVGGYRMNGITRRMRRADDMVIWGRGLATTEVASLFRWAAEDFRARPTNEGVYDVEGTHEAAPSRGGAFLTAIRTLSRVSRHGSDDLGRHMTATMAIIGMLNNVFVNETTPDPDAAVVLAAEDITPMRLAEITQNVIELINELGWTDTYLFHPQTGAVSTRGAVALTVDLPPRSDYLNSKVHLTERRWVEMWAWDSQLADHLSLPTEPQPCPGCGEVHTTDRVAPWENGGRTQDEVITALTRFRDTQVALAAHDAGLGDVEDFDWSVLERQLTEGSGGPAS